MAAMDLAAVLSVLHALNTADVRALLTELLDGANYHPGSP